jgi:potassium uptake Trk family protein
VSRLWGGPLEGVQYTDKPTDFWVIGLTIVGSILLYPAGNLRYIDALFFASGANTQSGLNTVDVNLLNTYQQMVLFFLPMLSNPITINTFVVFLRLYWFEKRFQHIAQEAKRSRISVSKSRSKMKGERDLDQEEKGVNGRKIVVMHGTTRTNALSNDGAIPEDLMDGLEPSRKSIDNDEAVYSGSSDGSTRAESSKPAHDMQITPSPSPAPQAQGITFAAQVKRSDGLSDQQLRLPSQMSKQDHIAFLERQRNPEDRGVLRIPGPRDADAGVSPETVDEDEAVRQRARRPSVFDPRRGSEPDSISNHLNGDDHVNDEIGDDNNRKIRIEEPVKPTDHVVDDARAAAKTLGVLRFRKPRLIHGEKLHNSETHYSHLGSIKSRAKSFASIKTALSREKDDDMPYLSWQPTVGRNSAFVDLTEDQREELGGIEYRSLKSLALILVLYFWGFTFFGIVCLTPWMTNSKTYGSILDKVSQNKVWWGFFTTTSSFNDVGFTLTADSMISFQTAIWPLLLMSFLVIIGNTGFPIMLRFVIWVTSTYLPSESGIYQELKFLLDHPRRCFTLLFPSHATWWLFWILVGLNVVDLVLFIILDVRSLS